MSIDAMNAQGADAPLPYPSSQTAYVEGVGTLQLESLILPIHHPQTDGAVLRSGVLKIVGRLNRQFRALFGYLLDLEELSIVA